MPTTKEHERGSVDDTKLRLEAIVRSDNPNKSEMEHSQASHRDCASRGSFRKVAHDALARLSSVKTLRDRTRRATLSAKDWLLARSRAILHRKSLGHFGSMAQNRVSNVALVGSTSGVDAGDGCKLNGCTPSSRVLARDKRLAIDPNGRGISIWRVFLLAILLYDVLVVPLMLCDAMINESVCAMAYGVYAGEIFFLADFGVNLHVGFDKDGDVMRLPDLTRRRYLCSRRFALDLVAILPLYVIPVAPSMCGLVHLNKLVRAVYLTPYTIEFDKVFARRFIFCKIVKVIVVCYMCGHYVACVYLMFGFSDGSETGAWRLHHPLAHASFAAQYFGALFWSIGIISKSVEGQVPRTALESLFMLFVMFGGFLLFVYICGTLFMMSKCDMAHQEILDAKVNQLRHVLSYHKVPQDMQDRAVEYIEHEFKSGDTNDKSNMKLLCPSIAKDVKFTMLKGMVANVPFFRRCSNSFLRALIDLTETEAIPANFPVVTQGDVGDNMYFVQSGVLIITLDRIKVLQIVLWNSFGELALFTNRTRSASVTSVTFCILHKLARLQVHQVLSAYPEFEDSILDCVAQLVQAFDGENSKIVDPTRRLSLRHILETAGEETTCLPTEAPKATILQEPRAVTGSKRYRTTFFSSTSVVPEVGRNRSKSLPPRRSNPPPLATAPVEVSPPRWVSFLLATPITRRSRCRLMWLASLQAAMWYNLFTVTLLNTFRSIGYPTTALVLNTIADMIYLGDIYGQLNLSYIVEAEQIMDPIKCARRYFHGAFCLDVVGALPWWLLAPSQHLVWRILRLLRCRHIEHEFNEVAVLIRITSRRRIAILGFGLFIAYHMAACIAQSYILLAPHDPSHPSELLPPPELQLPWNSNHTAYINVTTLELIAIDDPAVPDILARQYLRVLYYGAVCVTNLGLPLEPEALGESVLGFFLMLMGMLLISALIDEVQKRVTASALEQMAFLSQRSRIEHFLKCQNVPSAIHRRASAYLDFWWSVHRGANINELLSTLPNNLQRDIYAFICRPFLDVVAGLDKTNGAFPSVSAIFLDNVHIQLFGQGELLYRKSDHAECIYMVLDGRIAIASSVRSSPGATTRNLGPGDLFGLSVLEIENEHAMHAECAIAQSSCVVVAISRETLVAMQQVYVPLCAKLLQRVQKGQTSRGWKLARKHVANVARAVKAQPVAIDPEGTFAVAWEIAVFVAIVFDCITVPFFLAFGYDMRAALGFEGIEIALEVGFFVDLVLHFRIGYWEFGNKVMDVPRIRKQYLVSSAFCVDVVALLPFYVANYGSAHYLELWHVNKLLRVTRVPGLLQHLERYFYRHAITMRVLRTVLYTYLLAHFVGCAWYSFGSNVLLPAGAPNFGDNIWLPSATYDLSKNASTMTPALAYAHCYHWGIGMLFGFQPGKHPVTPFENVFTIFVQTLGVFLLSYIVGNLLDVAAVMDGNNRLFYSNLNYVRKLLAYFDFSNDVAARVQHFYFYRLFHSIHEEHVLAKCLPPTLLADVRLFLLTPMLNKVPFFQGEHASSSITRVLVSQMSQILVTRGEVVCRQNEIGMEMYFVFAGCLEIYVANDMHDAMGIHTFAAMARGTKITEIHDGSFFGEKSLFSNQPRNASIQAKTFCTLFRLSRTHLESVFAQYPEWKAKVMQIVTILYKKHDKQVREKTEEQQSQANSRDAANSRYMSRALSNKVMPAPESKRSETLPRPSTSFKTVLDGVRGRIKKGRLLTWREHITSLLHIQVQTPIYRRFMKLFCAAILYNAMSIPFLLTFGHHGISPEAFAVVTLLNVTSDLVFLYDIWFKRHIVETTSTREFYEGDIFPKGGLVLDVLAVIPFDYLLGAIFQWSALLRLNRLIKGRQFNHAVHEINRFSMAYEINRLALLGLYYFLCVYWTACAYFGLTILDGFTNSWETFLPSHEFETQEHTNVGHMVERVLRCLYFSASMYTGAGIVHEPSTLLQYAFLNLVSVFGVFVLSYILGEASSLFIYLIQNEVEFKINHMNVIEFLHHKRMGAAIEARVRSYLTYWWSAQKGVMYQNILEQLPTQIRCHAVIQITRLSLSRFATTYLRPLCHDVGNMELVIYSLAQRLVFEGYPVGESVIVQGNIGKTMYFVSKGALISASTEPDFFPSRFADGQYFGEEGFLGASVCHYSVVTLRSCDLLSLSAADFVAALCEHPLFVECATVARHIAHRLATAAIATSHPIDFDVLVWSALHASHPPLQYLKFDSIDSAVRSLDHFVKLFLSHNASEALGSKWQKPMMCKRCESDVAVYYCAACMQTMCAECSIKVHGSPEYASHLQTITDVSSYKRPPTRVSPARRMTLTSYAPK
ncbi:hypothetical protein SPRG_10248 [Saprolegnia parasitica CBS 223.65]|uniref:Cyclic nucleotide-binding domain-containing protein n=1 Tax=Saprolegnia parasitica (strain CBS 223.65) TaxID=695850 RepID=A0A067C1T9_SAPPC|nr:hypothetical protein SPRG_10248 [Saprolegnia parasitica CBS 223.65]KDO24714.1 hypothetical protein SPRG_10248 [Saprolegnia parasitica CBS 223.65]|eukprot:XP_012204594.1 hypothetical protein SPRG_10248 [Saprolegnia parasitica CBS 223.65]